MVCTGNICRSPAAERLLRHGLVSLGVGEQTLVESAGTGAVVGHPIQADMAELLTADGVRADEFAARQITRELIDEAELILVAAQQNRQRLVRLRPQALTKSFTLKEFARLVPLVPTVGAPTDPAQRLRWLTRHAPMARGRQTQSPGGDDIADPYMQGDDSYSVAYSALRSAVDKILSQLG
ncbi:MAG: hypothetical protein WBO35_04920 [Candidatus Saccharimonadales bacterium]